MKRIAILFLPIIAAGCQSDANVRSAPPLASFTSIKSADASVACLVPALGVHWNASGALMNQRFVAQVIAPGVEYDIVPTDSFVNGHYTFTINVKQSGSGSAISLYKGQMMLPSITRAMREGINSCL